MRTRTLAWALILVLAFSGAASALSIGDELSSLVSELNVRAQADFSLFKTELSVEFGVTVGKIDELIAEVELEPGDVYVTLELARMSEKPVEDVVGVYKVNKTKGWGALAKELGIEPGSPEFKALKESGKDKDKGKPKNK
ncbi:MAG: hypothetical protein GX322_04540 [Firmicutes bacterium]|nr:hypothetical protein [Bacillota bacterium]